MVYNFVFVFIVLNLVYEVVEFIFPVSKISGFVKSFSLIVLLYAMSSYLLNLL